MSIDFSHKIFLYVLSYVLFPGICIYNLVPVDKKIRDTKFIDNKMSLNLKGVAMILIVIHHITLYMTNEELMLPFSIVGYIGSGVFLFVSGYGCMYSLINNKRYMDSFLKKRFVSTYIIAIICISFNSLILRFFLEIKYSITNMFLNTLVLYSSWNNAWVWFIIAIFISWGEFYILFKYVKNRKCGIILLWILGFAYIFLCRYLDLGKWWYNSILMFQFGVTIASYRQNIIKALNRSYVFIIIISLLIFLGSWSLQFKLDYIITEIICLFAFIVLLISIMYKVRINSAVLEFIGTISFEIYLFHSAIIMFIYYTTNIKNSIIIFVDLVLTVVLSFIINKVYLIIKNKIIRI
jgi:membrane-bound acyltransferase YfiQ involved in biofilm formation